MENAVLSKGLLIILSISLALLGLAYLLKGMRGAWEGTDADLQQRFVEYDSFVHQIYPNMRLAMPNKPRATAHTVYPPYAFPMFSAFFGFGSLKAARFLLELMSIGSLLLMMFQGARLLAPGIPGGGWLGASLPLAIAGNCHAMLQSQFSILCMGAVTLQIMLLRKERSLAAGFCWALAMLKPQIGFPFLFLFILTKSWTGLLAGFMILVVMSEAALLWTGLNPWSYLLAGPLTESFSFTKEQSATGAALWMTGINLSAPFAAFAALLAVIILGGVYAVRQNRIQLPLLDAAGVCSAIGFVLFYHRSYDNIMLYPLILAIFHRMLQDRGNYFIIAVCLLLAFTAFLPVGLIGRHQVLLYLSLLTPIVGAGVLLVRGNSNVPMNQRTYLPLK